MFIRQAEGPSASVVTQTDVVTQASTVVIQATNAPLAQPSPQSPAGTSPAPQAPSPPPAESSLFLDTTGGVGAFPSSFLDPNLPGSTEANAIPVQSLGSNGAVPGVVATGKARASDASSSSLSPGLISGIVICAVLVVMAILAVLFRLHRRHQRQAAVGDDARSTMFWDSPPRPMMRGGTVSLKPKHFAPPSHTYMQRSGDPYRDSTAVASNITAFDVDPAPGPVAETVHSGSASSYAQQHSLPPLSFNNAKLGPFSDPITSPPQSAYSGVNGCGSPSDEHGGIPNPFADPRESYHGGVAL